MTTTKRLLVAVHDVTPAHASQREGVFGLLAEFGVERYAMLVVPDWHGEWPLNDHGNFNVDLKARQDAGAEVLLHGYRHDEVGAARTPGHRLRTWGRTAREAEFLSLTPEEAGFRIDRGLAVLRRCGLEPVGFVPPAWFHGRDAYRLLEERDLMLTEDAWAVVRLPERRRVRAPAVQWSTRKRWRAAAGVAIAAARVPLERRRRLVRIAIHPSDMDLPSVARSVRATLEALLRVRTAVSYHEALGVGVGVE